ncbi:MAG: hypothetical protein ACD_16C00205G0040 [uncultured bacterium]|nr:MAG: hypothetical protein ACD_16C00205G0040 [uncultured bacterium]OFW68775.1 MAG: hypothetical protein A2X70_04680 [Alphaproteobacteria bacterium GWC2_42_16]OFW73282.1 MAG: hypothetical protein A2Z80_03860 [Alphaproteobacteria bacterium GWA2_41_27]OFW81885.1 MAG: hypothetical protein A3E50_07185 [Alphaproteobacteria bacterium RIFCSPHIGHO2_12_FULL_42_100]OFW84876.1 MAG: hypothetical protein A2W06_03385 [Alphaproteobacteria bacterium RBG_16_42_14]OFW90995.1 MAG: hypothetical protein A3C41_041
MTYKTFTAVAFALTTFTLNANAACPCAKWFPPTDCSSEYSKVSPSYYACLAVNQGVSIVCQGVMMCTSPGALSTTAEPNCIGKNANEANCERDLEKDVNEAVGRAYGVPIDAAQLKGLADNEAKLCIDQPDKCGKQ